MTNRVIFMDQAGFIVLTDKVIMVFDYTRDPAHALHRTLEQNPELPVVFFSTDHHAGHSRHSQYELAQNHRRVYVMSNEIYPQNVPSTLEVAGMSAGDVLDSLPGDITVKAYKTLGKGIGFLVTEKDGTRIFHTGDSVSRLTDQKQVYDFQIAVGRMKEEFDSVDIAFLPVDTRMTDDCHRVADIFLKAVQTANLFPMDFDGEFIEACNFTTQERYGATIHCLHTPGQSIALAAQPA